MNEQSGGVYCEKCKICLARPRKRKHFQEECFIVCESCSIENPLLRAFSKMNRCLDAEERKVVNQFRFKLWECADLLEDLCYSPCNDNDFRRLKGRELKDLVCKIPILEK